MAAQLIARKRLSQAFDNASAVTTRAFVRSILTFDKKRARLANGDALDKVYYTHRALFGDVKRAPGLASSVPSSEAIIFKASPPSEELVRASRRATT